MDYIKTQIDEYPVLLFMKGTPEQPQCRFSAGVVKILQALEISFKGVDVMRESHLREDLKIFSKWPTFPQLYVKGELIGGYDIVQEMYEKEELSAMFQALGHL